MSVYKEDLSIGNLVIVEDGSNWILKFPDGTEIINEDRELVLVGAIQYLQVKQRNSKAKLVNLLRDYDRFKQRLDEFDSEIKNVLARVEEWLF